MITTFGALPIGTGFTITCREKDPADRRRWIYVPRRFEKTRHGSIAGFARQYGLATERSERRFDHYTRVTVYDDLRLIVRVLRHNG